MITRRILLRSALAALASGPVSSAAAQGVDAVRPGGADGGAVRLSPRGGTPMTAEFQAAIDAAAATGAPLVLGAGTYTVGTIRLRGTARIVGMPGATRLALAGRGALLRAAGASAVRLEGLALDGGRLPLGDDAALVALSGVPRVVVDDCAVGRSSGSGLMLEGCGGRVERSTIAEIGQYGLFARDFTGLAITGNSVSDCGNGGVLVWRSQAGDDGTIVSGNRIARIRADAGGTGQNGNGINVYRAGGVSVAGNRLADCAFSAIRANSGSDVAIAANQCHRSGETAIYVEFAFQGAVVADNIVDAAANGIAVVNLNEGGRLASVSGNVVRNLRTTGPYRPDPPGFGIGIGVEGDAAVTGNIVEGAPTIGIVVGFGSFLRDVVVNANVVRDCGVGIAPSVVEGAGPAVITGNIIRQARRGAIVGHRFAEPATGDLSATGAEVPRHLTIAGNRVEA